MAEANVVRAWARENGVPVGARGRLSAELFSRYDLAQKEARRAARAAKRAG